MTTSETELTPAERFTDAMRQLVRVEFDLQMGHGDRALIERAEVAMQDAFNDAVDARLEELRRNGYIMPDVVNGNLTIKI